MIDVDNLTALQQDHASRIYFIFLDFAGDPIYACSANKTYTTLGQDWLGMGEVGGISDLVESVDIAARPLSFSLSGVDPWIVEPLLSRVNYKGGTAQIWLGLLESNSDLVADPELVWSGRMDVGSVIYDKNTAAAQLVCEPDSARLLRSNVSRYSDEDHQLRYPGDRFYEYIPQISQKDLVWGGRIYGGTSSAGGGGNRGGYGEFAVLPH